MTNHLVKRHTKGYVQRTIEESIDEKITVGISNEQKVSFMEFLLIQPLERLKSYMNDNRLPSFFVVAARMLWTGEMEKFMEVLRSCRDMVQEDKERESFR